MIQVFVTVTPCRWAVDSDRFEGTHCLHIQVQVVKVVLFGMLDPEVEDTESYKMSGITHDMTQHHIPEGSPLTCTFVRSSSCAVALVLCRPVSLVFYLSLYYN